VETLAAMYEVTKFCPLLNSVDTFRICTLTYYKQLHFVTK
jgi:hypothetical protein